MHLKVLLIVLPSFIIMSIFLIYLLFVHLGYIFIGIIYSIISLIVGITLVKAGLYSPQSHFENISKETIDIQKIDVTFEDGVKSKGLVYRSLSETLSTPSGKRYQNPRPMIIFFHGFMDNKEIYNMYMIPLAQMGYITAAFDQRGHGEAGGKKEDMYKLYNDVKVFIDKVCSFEDVKEGAICCIGKSMGGTSVLTRGYEDQRVAMVIGIAALHDVDLVLERDFPFLSGGWWIKRAMKNLGSEPALNMVARNFLKSDAEYNKKRVYLLHGEKDSIFPPEITFKLNKKQAKIPDDQAILIENCGHNFSYQEPLIFGIILKWILENEKMRIE
ncbi:MAG: alpha/beta hydrolase [Promethearchaeota archaeon]|nr:MAG: alpha/beta hydrolase [Candidatus Lokiarchaeota archaeon]